MFLTRYLRVFVTLLVLLSLSGSFKTFASENTSAQGSYLWVEIGSNGGQLVDSRNNGEAVLELSPGIQIFGQSTNDGWLSVTFNSETYYLDLKTVNVLSEKTNIPETAEAYTDVPEGTKLSAVDNDAEIITVSKDISLPEKVDNNGQQLVIIGETLYKIQGQVESNKIQPASVNKLDNNQNVNNQSITFGSYFSVIKKTAVYEKPDSASNIVGYLLPGETFKRTNGSNSDWHEISFGGKACYVNTTDTAPTNSYLVSNSAPDTLKTSGTITVTGEAPVYDNTRKGQGLVPFASVASGVTYPVVGKYGTDWWEVIVDGRIGYIYYSIVGHVSMPFQSSDQFFKVTADNVTVYDNSTGKLIPIGSLLKGEVFQRSADYGDWHQIKFGSGYGYVWKEATEPASSSSIKNLNTSLKNSNIKINIKADTVVYAAGKIPFAKLNKGTSYPIVADSGDWWQVLAGGRVGYVYKSEYATRDFTKTDKYFKVILDNVTVYDNSSGKLVPIGSLIKGQVYPRISDMGDWHQIKFGSGYGYVWKAATIPDSGAAATGLIPNAKSTGDFITIRANVAVYAAGKNQIAVLTAGTKYPIIGEDSDWWYISLAGRMGYVYKSTYATRNFRSSDRYFQLLQDNVTVYDNSTGKLIPIGQLEKNRIYTRVSDYGDWHKIKYAGHWGYVWKDATVPFDITNKRFVPIITYHNLTTTVSDGANISPAVFRQHMQYFKDKGYQTITLDQLLNFLNGEGSLPSKPLMITFDDSYLSQYTIAYPILKELGMKATYFAIVGMLGDKMGSLQEFTWDQAREMEASGVVDIESHSYMSHNSINGKALLATSLPGETNEQYVNRITNDLTLAKSTLEQQLNKKVRALAYPFGSWNETLKNVAKAVGYEALFQYDAAPGIVYQGESPFMIDRTGIDGNMSADYVLTHFLHN